MVDSFNKMSQQGREEFLLETFKKFSHYCTKIL